MVDTSPSCGRGFLNDSWKPVDVSHPARNHGGELPAILARFDERKLAVLLARVDESQLLVRGERRTHRARHNLVHRGRITRDAPYSHKLVGRAHGVLTDEALRLLTGELRADE